MTTFRIPDVSPETAMRLDVKVAESAGRGAGTPLVIGMTTASFPFLTIGSE